jgi:hypothetical protein
MTRRTFLRSFFYLGSLQFLEIGWNLDKRGASGDTKALVSKLANFYVDKKSARIVGREYLRSVPAEAKTDFLVDLICSFDRTQRTEFAQAEKYKLQELLLMRQRRDFEHERVVNVRGWILSETECRLCALAAII